MQLVSETVEKDRGYHTEPLYPKRFETPAGFNLSCFREWADGQPWWYYKKLHEQAPISWTRPQRSGEDGFWALVDHAAVQACSLDSETFSSMRGGIHMSLVDSYLAPKALAQASLDNFINLDEPYHRAVRTQLRSFFTPKYLENLRKKIDIRVAELLDNLEKEAAANGGVADFAKCFSAELPGWTACELLGVNEPENRSKILHWMWYMEQVQALVMDRGYLLRHPTRLFGANRAAKQILEFGAKMAAERRAAPKDDLLTAITSLQYDGELLPEPYQKGSWFLMVFAGTDTTKNSLSGTLKLLSDHKEAREEVRRDRSLLSGMIEEAMRMISPVIHMRRTATRPTEVLGQKIAEGEKLILYYGAATRDPKLFEDPDRFDIHRSNARKALAFGFGPHMCLGRLVGMAQLESAYSQILDRYPNFEVVGAPEMQANNFVAVCNSMKVRLNA